MGSIVFGDTLVPIIEYDSILLLGIVFYIGNIILLGFTTKKHWPGVVWWATAVTTLDIDIPFCSHMAASECALGFKVSRGSSLENNDNKHSDRL